MPGLIHNRLGPEVNEMRRFLLLLLMSSAAAPAHAVQIDQLTRTVE